MSTETDPILYWNRVVLEAHRPGGEAEGRGRSPAGLIRTARAFAMVHLAMHDAWRACHGPSEAPYLANVLPPERPLSAAAAVGAAARGVLAGLCPRVAFLDAREDRWSRALAAAGVAADALARGRAYGAEVAEALLDPFTRKEGFLDAGWAFDAVAEARVSSGRPPVPAAPVRGTSCSFGDESFGEDAGAAPSFYNHCLRVIAVGRALSTGDVALLFALANVAMADAAIATWARARGHLPPGAVPAAVSDDDPTLGTACFRAAASFLAHRFADGKPLDRMDFDPSADGGAAERPAGGRRIALAVGRAANDSDGDRVYLGVPNVIVPHRRAG